MASFKSWISALRPRTLFLAAATALCGNALAYSSGQFSSIVFVLTLSLALMLQLLSNLANDLGDFEHGTDVTGNRVGPERALQSGSISSDEMKHAIYISTALCAIIGLLLVYIALEFMNIAYILGFLLLGLASIIAATRYTSGKNPYGYNGWGDLFSFFFFGPVAVIGTYFLNTHQVDFRPFLPAFGLGLLTASVLNVNNMRDLENDKASNKITIPVRIGFSKAKQYHSLLTFGALLCFVAYSIIYSENYWQNLYMISFLLFIKIIIDINKTKDKSKLDPYLKHTSLATFILSLAFSICISL